MTAAVFAKIAEYFKLIHANVVWPTAKLQPPAGATQTQPFGKDRLSEINDALLTSYVKCVQMFEEGCRPCVTNDDCLDQGDICDNGVCRPKPGAPCRPMYSAASGKPCVTNDDCLDQNEICFMDRCVPRVLDLELADGNFVGDDHYLKDLENALVAYYARLQDVIAAGLGRRPSKLPEVRDYLMRTCARLAAACDKLPCQNNGDCAEGSVCINGRCVPYPFRLVFRRPTATLKAPWTL